jgi:hypothetical protein
MLERYREETRIDKLKYKNIPQRHFLLIVIILYKETPGNPAVFFTGKISSVFLFSPLSPPPTVSIRIFLFGSFAFFLSFFSVYS